MEVVGGTMMAGDTMSTPLAAVATGLVKDMEMEVETMGPTKGTTKGMAKRVAVHVDEDAGKAKAEGARRGKGRRSTKLGREMDLDGMWRVVSSRPMTTCSTRAWAFSSIPLWTSLD